MRYSNWRAAQRALKPAARSGGHKGGTMIVLQFADLHAVEHGARAYKVADTNAMFQDAVNQVGRLRQRPDCVVFTGDLASGGSPEAYAIIKEGLERLDVPVYVIPGNHDKREGLVEYLGEYCPADPALAPHLCYIVDNGPMRLVMLDTSIPGGHHGQMPEAAAAWLDKALGGTAKPTLLFMHHLPFHSGMGYMDEPFENLELLASIVRGHPHVRLCCGHIHRGLVTQWQGRIAVAAPAASMQMEVDLSARGGDTFFLEAPGYVLHTLIQGEVMSYFCEVACKPTFSGPHPFLGLNL